MSSRARQQKESVRNFVLPAKIQLSDLTIVPFNPQAHNAAAFDCGDSDLNDFLQNDAHRYQQAHVSFTRVVFYQREFVGYITLLTDSIVLKSGEKRKIVDFHQHVMQWPALKIGRLAVCQERQKKYGIGRYLLQYSIALALRTGLEHSIGCRFITVDAYPTSVSFYEHYSFIRNKHYTTKPDTSWRSSRWCPAFLRKTDPSAHPSMRYDILKSPPI